MGRFCSRAKAMASRRSASEVMRARVAGRASDAKGGEGGEGDVLFEVHRLKTNGKGELAWTGRRVDEFADLSAGVVRAAMRFCDASSLFA